MLVRKKVQRRLSTAGHRHSLSHAKGLIFPSVTSVNTLSPNTFSGMGVGTYI